VERTELAVVDPERLGAIVEPSDGAHERGELGACEVRRARARHDEPLGDILLEEAFQPRCRGERQGDLAVASLSGAIVREDPRERATIERAAAGGRLDEHDARAPVGPADDLVVCEAVEHLVRHDEPVASEAEPSAAAREIGARPSDGRRERPELRALARDECGAPLDDAVAERAREGAPGRVVGAVATVATTSQQSCPLPAPTSHTSNVRGRPAAIHARRAAEATISPKSGDSAVGNVS
jgi:hypothetical protein